MLYIAAYWLILFVYSILMWRRNRTDSSFLVHERKSGAFSVAMSLIALVFGASSVFGLAGYAHMYSLNAIWWTLSGIIFLILLKYLFTSQIVALKAFTVSDTVSSVFGSRYKIVTSTLVLVSWVMILAGQIIAGGNILSMIIGHKALSYALFCMIFFSYTFVTGQSGTIRTSWIQTLIMIVGVAVLLGYVLSSYNVLPSQNARVTFGFTENFSPGFLLNILIPVGLSYLFGPDIYSRIFTARDTRSAGRGILIACVFIAIISLMIVLIGIFGGQVLGKVAVPDQIIPELATHEFSGMLKNLILVALISIPLSGADAMLANMGTLLGKDIFGGMYSAVAGRSSEKTTVMFIRISMIIISAAAVAVALNSQAIIPTLLIAYTVFSVVVVPFLMVSMLSLKYAVEWKNRTMNAVLAMYMVISAAVVVLLKLQIVTFTFQYVNLCLIAGNIIIFFLLFLVMKKQTHGLR